MTDPIATGTPAAAETVAPVVAPVAPPAPVAAPPTAPAVIAPVAPAAPVVETPAAAAVAKGGVDPEWFSQRVKAERAAGQAAAYKALGFSTEAEAKAAADAHRAKVEAEKTASQRATELAAELATEKAANEANAAVIRDHATRVMAGLGADQLAIVTKLAGTDPREQLRIISTLYPTGQPAATATPAAPVAAAPPPTTPATPPAPASTTLPNGAPPPVSSGGIDHFATYKAITHPVRAAQYYLRHQAAITAAEHKRTTST